MLESISKTEKLDILLTLALAFEQKLGDEAEGNGMKAASEMSERFFAVFSEGETGKLKARAEYFDKLPAEKKNVWQKTRLEKIRRRGLFDRLDANIHSAQIARILDSESKAVQLLVLKNLPSKLSRKIASSLKSKLPENEFVADQTKAANTVNDEIIKLVRKEFVSNFVAFEDIFEPTDTDKISLGKLDEFLRHLGVRETAIACRGISSKETLAAFLNRFDEDSAKEIAENITELENVKPFWVERADRLLRKTLENQFQPESLLRSLGFKILSIAYVRRDWAARKYTAQKMLPFEAENWMEMLAESRLHYKNADENERAILDRRKRIVERLAGKFV